jgi:hypothetical protein
VTDLDAMKAMLTGADIDYTEHPVEDWKRFHDERDAWERELEERTGKPWRDPENKHLRPGIEKHNKPGWTTLRIDLTWHEADIVFKPDGKLWTISEYSP